MTDGITECPSPSGEELGEEGLIAWLEENRELSGAGLLDGLVWALSSHYGSEDFPDDLSGLLLDYSGSPPR